jgi:hypothetical protein
MNVQETTTESVPTSLNFNINSLFVAAGQEPLDWRQVIKWRFAQEMVGISRQQRRLACCLKRNTRKT